MSRAVLVHAVAVLCALSAALLLFVDRAAARFFLLPFREWQFLAGALVALCDDDDDDDDDSASGGDATTTATATATATATTNNAAGAYAVVGWWTRVTSAWATTTTTTKTTRVRTVTFWSCVATLLALSMCMPRDGWPHAGALPVVLVTALALACRVDVDNVVLRRVGDWSYSIYLYHWPVICFAEQLVVGGIVGDGDGGDGGDADWDGGGSGVSSAMTGLLLRVNVVVVVVSLVLAVCSYYVVESTTRTWRRGDTTFWLAFLLATSVLLALVSTAAPSAPLSFGDSDASSSSSSPSSAHVLLSTSPSPADTATTDVAVATAAAAAAAAAATATGTNTSAPSSTSEPSCWHYVRSPFADDAWDTSKSLALARALKRSTMTDRRNDPSRLPILRSHAQRPCVFWTTVLWRNVPAAIAPVMHARCSRNIAVFSSSSVCAPARAAAAADGNQAFEYKARTLRDAIDRWRTAYGARVVVLKNTPGWSSSAAALDNDVLRRAVRDGKLMPRSCALTPGARLSQCRQSYTPARCEERLLHALGLDRCDDDAVALLSLNDALVDSQRRLRVVNGGLPVWHDSNHLSADFVRRSLAAPLVDGLRAAGVL